MYLASGVVLCPVLCEPPTFIPPTLLLSIPLCFEHPPLLSFSRWLSSCSIPRSRLPAAFSWASGWGLCVPAPGLSTMFICLLSPPFGTSVCFQLCLQCDRHHASTWRNSPALILWHIPQITTCVSYLSLIWRVIVLMVGPHALLALAQSFLLRLKGNADRELCSVWRAAGCALHIRTVPSEDQDAMLVFKNVCHTNVQRC